MHPPTGRFSDPLEYENRPGISRRKSAQRLMQFGALPDGEAGVDWKAQDQLRARRLA